MLRTIIDASVRHRVVALLITACITAFGIHAFMRTSIEAFPDVTNLQVNVIAQADGLAPEEMELQVTVPLERALNGIPGAELMRSESLFGLSLIWVVFEDNADGFRARTHVMERLMEADLPDDVSVELSPDATPLGKVLYYRLLSDTHTLTDLRTIQETTIERSLRQVQGVADVTSIGGYLKEVHVELIPEQLHNYGLTILDVLERVENSNKNAGGGFLVHGDQEFVIRSIGRIEDAEDIRSIVLDAKEGVTITLGDVANVYQGHTPRRGGASADHDDEIVQGIVMMRRGENPSDLLKALHERIDELNNGGLPDDVEIDILYDRGDMVGRTLSTVYGNLLHGALFVIAVCWLFLRIFRGSLTVAIVIPLSLVTAFIGLYALDLPANLISMGAVDFGIFVDGGVVLVENVQKHIRKERPQTKEALRDVVTRSALEVARPTFFAMSIIIAAMLPIFSLESVEGRIFRPLALTYVFALIGALIASLTVVPALSSIMFKVEDADVEEFAFVTKITNGYERLLRWLTQRRWLVALTAVLIFVIAGFVAKNRGTEFLPELDEGDIYIFAEAPPSIGLSAAASRFNDIRNTIQEFPEVKHVLSEQGRPEDGTDNEGVNLTKLFVLLHPSETWETGRTKAQLVEDMREVLTQYPGISFNFSQPIKDSVEEAVSGVRGQVVLKTFGRDFDKMRDVLVEAMKIIEPIEGVADLDLYRDTIVPQLQIKLDRPALARHGVVIEDAQDVVATVLAGTVATSYFEEEFRIPIRISTPFQDKEDEAAIGSILVPTPDGMFIPLRELATIEMSNGRSTIPREQNVRYLALKFNIEDRDAGSVVNEAIETVERELELPEGVTIQWGGEFENQQRAMARLQIVVPLALLIVLVLLITAMRSVPLALIVMGGLPFALTGGFFGLWLVNEEISVSAAIGFIALVGQTSLLGLIMLSHLADDPRTAPGTGKRENVPLVASDKLRAILTAALLTSFGLLPMAMSTAMGSETQRPFAAVIVAGMSTTLAVAIFVVPIAYAAWTFRKDPKDPPPTTGASTPSPAAASLLIALLSAGALLLVPTDARAQDAPQTTEDSTPTRTDNAPEKEDAAIEQTERSDLLSRHHEINGVRIIPADFDALMQLLNNHESWSAQKDAYVGAAEAGRKLARAFEDPEFSYEFEAFTGRGTDYVDGSQHEFMLEWELPLQRIRAARSDVVDAEVELARAEFSGNTWELAQRLREAWGEVEIEYARANALQDAIEHLSETLDIINKRVEHGVTSRYDKISAETRMAKLERALERSLDELVRNALFVTKMLGQEDGLLLPQQHWTPPNEDDVNTQLEDQITPEIMQAIAESKLAEAEANVARKERVPNIVLSGGLGLATDEPGRAALGGVAMRLPIFGSGRGAVQKADAEAQAATLRQEWLQQLADAERDAILREWAIRYNDLSRHDETIVPRILELERFARRAYQEGTINYADLNDALDERIETNLDRIELLEELMELYIELQKWMML